MIKQKIKKCNNVNCSHGKGIKFIREELKFLQRQIFNQMKVLILKQLFY